MSAALTGNDTFTINNQVLDTGLADGNVVELDFENPIVNMKIGKNNNALVALNTMGNKSTCKIRTLRGNFADQFLNNLLSQQIANTAGFVLMQGSFTKKLGDGAGNITSDTYVTSGGVFRKQVPVTSNVEGNTDQAVSMYEIEFASAARTLF